jgi:hypothetical protein
MAYFAAVYALTAANLIYPPREPMKAMDPDLRVLKFGRRALVKVTGVTSEQETKCRFPLSRWKCCLTMTKEIRVERLHQNILSSNPLDQHIIIISNVTYVISSAAPIGTYPALLTSIFTPPFNFTNGISSTVLTNPCTTSGVALISNSRAIAPARSRSASRVASPLQVAITMSPFFKAAVSEEGNFD